MKDSLDMLDKKSGFFPSCISIGEDFIMGITFNYQANESFTCPLCFHDKSEGLAHALATKTDQVFHRFCKPCLLDWLNIRQVCPECEGNVTKINMTKSDPTDDYMEILDIVEQGKTELVRLLYDKIASSECVHQFVGTAAGKGHLEIVRMLYHRLSEDHQGCLVWKAAQNGHMDIVCLVLTDHKISEINLGLAVEYAAKGGRIDIIRFLLEGRSILPSNRGCAAASALNNGYLDVALELVIDKEITSFWADRIMMCARRNGWEHRFAFELPCSQPLVK